MGVRAWGAILAPAVFAKEATLNQKGDVAFCFSKKRGWFILKKIFLKS
jgi:hypothetical protein